MEVMSCFASSVAEVGCVHSVQGKWRGDRKVKSGEEFPNVGLSKERE